MSTRGNVVIVEDDQPKLYFYSHYDSYDLPETVANALDRGRDRWDYEPYLNRILFSEMIKDNVLRNNGFGIDTVKGDGGIEVYVDPTNQTVKFNNTTYHFEDFIETYRTKD